MNQESFSQSKLRMLIIEAFDLEEIELLCTDVKEISGLENIKYQNLKGSTLKSKTQSLIEYCSRRGKLNDLLKLLEEKRPSVHWDEIKRPPYPIEPLPPQVDELVVEAKGDLEDFNEKKQIAIKIIIGFILNVPEIHITLKSIESGSVVLRFEVPAHSIQRLKHISENDKKKLAAHKVTQIRATNDSEIGVITIPPVGWLTEVIVWFKNLPKGNKIAFGLAPLVTIALIILAASTSGRFSLTNATPTAAIAEVNTETTSPTRTPIKCNDSDIVLGIFPQLAQELTTPFVGVSNATIDCDGVYDVFNSTPLAVRIKYEALPRSFAYFGINIPEGFDVSNYNQICVWVYTEESTQEFDLKLEDANNGKGVRIHPTKTSEWEERCVMLSGYPGVDLKNLTTITLSFNDSFGSVAIWVDDFELK